MIDHLSIGITDLERARIFYDAALAPLGYRRVADLERSSGYGPDEAHDDFYIVEARSPGAPRSGFHVAFQAPGRDAVSAYHAAALAAGATDDGPPGLRPHYHARYYAAYVVDPDGNRIEAVYHGRE